MSDPLIHVSVGGNPDDLEMKRIRDSLRDAFEGYTVTITRDEIEIYEVPALDEFADELADRVAERIGE